MVELRNFLISKIEISNEYLSVRFYKANVIAQWNENINPEDQQKIKNQYVPFICLSESVKPN